MCPRRLPTMLLTFALATSGCALLGPASVRNGRAAYNDALVTTNNEQVLGMIVRIRYGEPTGLLAVASVTANLRLQGTLGAEIGVGPESSYAGNLTPLTAGIAYEENPTISYTPVQGEKYLRQLLSPLPLDLTVLILGALGDAREAATLLVRGINGIRNPAFVADGGPVEDPRFARILDLVAGLMRRGSAVWAQEAGPLPSFVLAVSAAGPDDDARLRELCRLLGFAVPRPVDGVVTFPLRLGVGRPATPAIQLETRSLYELFGIAAATVDVPPEHLASGLAAPLPPLGRAGESIRIHRSQSRPRGAMIAVPHHGWWFAIDGTDARSKLTFRILESLMSVRMAETVEGKGVPVLTVPVSR